MCKAAGEIEQRAATRRGMYKLVIPKMARFDPILHLPTPTAGTADNNNQKVTGEVRQAAMDRHDTIQGVLNTKNYKDSQSRNYRQIELKKYWPEWRIIGYHFQVMLYKFS